MPSQFPFLFCTTQVNIPDSSSYYLQRPSSKRVPKKSNARLHCVQTLNSNDSGGVCLTSAFKNLDGAEF